MSDNGPKTYAPTWSTVCTDLKGTIYTGSSYHFHETAFDSSVTGLNPQWGAKVGGNFSQANGMAAIQQAANIYYARLASTTYSLNSVTYTRAEWWAAMQLAVWEALYDTGGSYSLTAGRFVVNAGQIPDAKVPPLAQLFLNNIGTTTYTGDLLQPLAITTPGWGNLDPSKQELMYMSATPVPETGTLLAGALLLIPFGMSTVRVLRKNRAS